MILSVFDLETTGLDRTKDSIIQFAGMKINTETHEVLDQLDLMIKPVGFYTISEAAKQKHHITEEMLQDKPTLPKIASRIIKFFSDTDTVLTYNGNGFDIPFLKFELNKFGFDIDFTSKKCFDAFLEEKRRNGINLENTYKRYKGISMMDAGLNPHDALSDIKATYAVFIAQQRIQEYGPEKMYGEDSVITDMEVDGEILPCFSIGKYRQSPIKFVAENDQNYLRWCVSDKCKFMESTKNYIKQYLK